MKTIKSYKKQLSKDVEEFLANGFSIVTSIEKTLKDLFPFSPNELANAEKAFEEELESSGFEGTNDVLAKAIPATRDFLVRGIDHIMLLERFISLHVPAMEDGNNFGVSVQMVVAKSLKETREAWTEKLNAIPSYYSSRAEAVEKLGVTKATESETKSETTTSSKGGKDGDENKTSSVVTKEEKMTGSPKRDFHRCKHVVATDMNCYIDLRATLVKVIDGYLMILDNMEKNKEKLSAPKGSGGGGSNMGMY